MSETTVTVRVSRDKLEKLRDLLLEGDDARAVERVVDEWLSREQTRRDPSKSVLLSMIGMFEGEKDMAARHDEDEDDTEAIVARLRRDFPDDPMVQLIGAISVPVDESPAEHHRQYGLGSDR